MSFRKRLFSLGATCAALVAISAAPAGATVAPLMITGTSGNVTMSNTAVDTTVTTTRAAGDLTPITLTASTGLSGFPVRVVGQEILRCEDLWGVHEYLGSPDSPWEIGGSSTITWVPSPCPTGQTAVYHQVTAQAQETIQLYVFGQGFRTETVTSGAIDFSWVFPQ